MSEKKPSPSVLELMDQISKYVAFLATLISALTFGLQIRGLSYVFVLVACTAFSLWFWRMAWERRPSGMLDPRGQSTYVLSHTKNQRVLILGAMVIIDLVGIGWLVNNLPEEFMARITSTSTPPGTSAPCPEGMVLIPEGRFWMGAIAHDSDARDDEKPGRYIYLDAFCIDRSEVSNQQYAEFVSDTGHTPPPIAQPEQPDSWVGDSYPPEYADFPVVRVSWFDARDYCRWRGHKLPSEAQWEKAARGTDGYIYPWGNDWDTARTNSARASWNGARPVDDYPDGQSPYGVLNMAGNVAEWIDDWYVETWYGSMSEANPVGPPDNVSDNRGLRGGSFWDGPPGLRTSARNGVFRPDAAPLAAMNFIGFRCACQNCVKH